MRILKRGSIEKTTMYGTCTKCGCQFDCLRMEAADVKSGGPHPERTRDLTDGFDMKGQLWQLTTTRNGGGP